MISIIRPRSQFSKEIKLKKYFNHELADTTGACLSVACAVHCLAMPPFSRSFAFEWIGLPCE